MIDLTVEETLPTEVLKEELIETLSTTVLANTRDLSLSSTEPSLETTTSSLSSLQGTNDQVVDETPLTLLETDDIVGTGTTDMNKRSKDDKVKETSKVKSRRSKRKLA